MFFFLKRTKLWTFWEIWLFQSHSTAILLPLRIFKKFKFSFGKRIYSLSKNFQKTQILNFFRSFNISVAAKLLHLAVFQKHFSLEKSFFFETKNQILNSLRNLTFSSESTAIFQNLAFSKNSRPLIVLRNLTIPVAFCSNFAFLGSFKKLKTFLR